MFQIQVVEKIKIHVLCFPKIVSFVMMSKNVVEPEGPQMTSQYGAYKLRAG
jgi:hypothetical protein